MKQELLPASVEEIELASTKDQDVSSSKFPSDVQADAGARAEKEMGVKEALHKWPMAILWSFLFGTSIIMEGYDLALLGAFWGYPTFQKQYGTPILGSSSNSISGEVEYQISAAWQSGIQSGVALASMVGVLIGGSLVQRYGYRPVFIGALCSIVVLVFGTVFSKNLPTLLVAEILLGFPWGVFGSLGAAYSSEIAPVVLRGYLTTYINLCWLIGQLLAAGILRALLSREDQWAYRIPFALQWIWPIPIIIAIFIAPESPWYLVRTGKLDAARRALGRCCYEERGVNLDNHLAMMIRTNELEQADAQGTSYIDCFKGSDLRRTEVSCMAWSIQQFCGSPFAAQAIYFFTVAGISTSTSFSLGIGTYALGVVGTFLSWILMTYFGRRSIYLCGAVVMTLLMLSIGIAAIFAQHSNVALFAQAGMMLAFVFIYNLSVGPVAYSLVSELSSTRLRAKTVGVARCFYNGIGLLASVIQPYLINPTAANLQGRAGFIWAALGALCTVWIFFRLPEPRNRTYEELHIMFVRRVPARGFSSYDTKRPD